MKHKQSKHNKVHLLIISETGRVKSRKISMRLVKWVVGVFLVLFALTSVFTDLYFAGVRTHRLVRDTSGNLTMEVNRLRKAGEERELELKRLKGVVSRLNKENQDLKQHLVSRKTPPKKKEVPPVKPRVGKSMGAYQNLLSQIEAMETQTAAPFRIRDPKITVSPNVTLVSFNLYKETLKKMTGRIVLMGLYKPENPETPGKVVAFPRRSVTGFRIHPAYGRYFRIEKQFLPVEARLPHPEGIARFSEFHVFVYGPKGELLFHEKFEAP